MEHFYEYIYTGFFGTYDPERLELINDFFTNVGKKNRFFDSETYECVIEYLIEQQNFTQAYDILSTAKSLFPDNTNYFVLEVLIIKRDNTSQAITLCNKYFKQYANPVFLLIKAIMLFEQHQYESGEKAHETFIKQLKETRWFAEAYFQAALHLNGDRYELLDESDDEFMTRTMLIKKFVEKGLKYPLELNGLIFYAMQFQTVENFREAKTILNNVIDKDSYNKEAWAMLSEILFKDEQYAEAADAYKYRIAINDGNTMNHFQCGVCYAKLGKWADALHYYELQEKNYPMMLMDNKEFYAELKNNQAECLMKMGAFDRALDMCLKTLKIDTNNFQTTVKVAQCYNFMNNNKEAISYLLKALKMRSDYQYNEYESLFETIGDIFAEISEGQEETERNDSLLNSILAYGKSLMFLNITGNAEGKNFDDIQLQNAIRMLKIGRSYMILGDYTNALINFQLANYMHAELPSLQCLLSICYYHLDFVKEAFIHFERIPQGELEQLKSFIPDLLEIEKRYNERNV